MTRCQYKIYDILQGYRNCKNKASFHVVKHYCSRHALMNIGHYCITIQRHYKGYRTRCKMNNLFINLPTDLQRKVLFHIREPLYLNKIYKKISSIIVPKIDDFLNSIDYDSIIFDREPSVYYYLFPHEIDRLCYILRLIIKYRIILPKHSLKEMLKITNTLHSNYILCNCENSIYNKEWKDLLRYFNIIKVLKLK